MSVRANELPVERLCAERWEHMPETEGGRHCAQCGTTVVDLARLTERAVRARLADGGVCVRYEVREDGTVITAGDFVAASRLLARARPLVFAASVALVPACGDAPPAEAPAHAPAPPRDAALPPLVPRRPAAEIPSASCEAPADAATPASPPEQPGAAGERRRRRQIIMGRYVLPRRPPGEGDTPYLTPDDFL